jgi:hypothetical protein
MYTIFNLKTGRIFLNQIYKLYHSERPKINKSIYATNKSSDEVMNPEVYEILKYGYPESRCKIQNL